VGGFGRALLDSSKLQEAVQKVDDPMSRGVATNRFSVRTS
jgi:hypothetical protein